MIKILNLENIENISLGRDTNSSSSHSLVRKIDDMLDMSNYDEYCGKFGNRQRFNCVSSESKAEYILCYLKGHIKYAVLHDSLLEKLKDYTFEFGEYDYVDDGYWLGEMIESLSDDSRLDLLLTLIYNESLAIIGGGDEDHTYMDYQRDIRVAHWKTIVKDMKNYFLILDKESGDKCRVKKHNDKHAELRPNLPELVDIKITNKCNQGCSFCYQNSTPDGVNCKTRDFKKFVDNLPKYTSLAIGGGEVWEHQDWVDMMFYAIDKEMLVNFTTNSLEFLDNDLFIKSLEYKIDYNNKLGVGVSVTSKDDLWKIDRISEFRKSHYSFDFYIHIIPGLLTLKDVDSIKEKLIKQNMNTNILMLGYKDVGRGESRELKPESEMKFILDCLFEGQKDEYGDRYYEVNIDTKLANDYINLMTKMFDKKTWYTEEGKYSAFYDATENKLYTSSYQKEDGIELKRGYDLEKEFSKLKSK